MLQVLIGNGAEKRAVNKKVWESETRKKATGNVLYDGNKLMWTNKNLAPEMRLMVNLDEGRANARTDGSNSFRLTMKRTKTLDISILQGYLQGRIQMGTQVLEAVNFLDHLLQEHPSNNPNFIKVKRSFFTRNGQRSDLGGGVEVFRGVYQTLRLAEGQKMVVNIDVANTCFFQPTTLTAAIQAKNRLRDPQAIIANCRPEQSNGTKRASAAQRKYAKDVKKIMVKAVYKGNPAPNKEWIIKDLCVDNARDHILEITDRTTQKVTKQSVEQYFRSKYNVNLQYPQLPLVIMTKAFRKVQVMFPMEFCHIIENQRYPFKLDETQTANMIKFAVSPPARREAAINEGKGWLNWGQDPVLKEFGMRIDSNMTKSNARLLPPPGVKFGKGKVEQPGTKGRWDLRGKEFLTPNPNELVAWGVGVFTNGRLKPDKSTIDNFIQGFSRAYKGHGGKVSNAPPHMMILPNDPGQAVEALHQATGNKYQRRPQLLVFLVQDKNSFHYLRIKKSCDCRYGVVSQVMQIAQVQKGNPQYYSNVLMKVNAKLGGCTTQVQSAPASGFKGLSAPTMFIGADVSHASPGSPQASMAALTVSFDRHGGRYAAACQTNGHRVEMISEANFTSMLKPLASQWMSAVAGGNLPAQVYYFRDGVSEGQFIHVMQQEVPHIKAVLSSLSNTGSWTGKITVIIASKRHHIRAFPAPGGAAADKNANPLPGVLIEKDVTMPYEWDFYLYSHIALQGTSRPVHYTVLHDEASHEPNRLQNMIYEHCYQYMRSTTSVSLFPAVYYAHLASNRAKAHEEISSSEGPQGGAGYKQNVQGSSEPGDSETKPLMPLFNANGIVFAMWYI